MGNLIKEKNKNLYIEKKNMHHNKHISLIIFFLSIYPHKFYFISVFFRNIKK